MSVPSNPDAELKVEDFTSVPEFMTEEEFLKWNPELVRGEWVDGKVVLKSLDTVRRDNLASFLMTITMCFARARSLGEVHFQNFAIRLAAQRTCRVPDVFFVAKERCALTRFTHFEGAPDLVMEIVAPDTVSRDWREKYREYEAAGVREYWIIDPEHERLEVSGLSSAGTFQLIPEREGRVESVVLPGFSLKPAWLWQQRLPSEFDILRELGVWS
jgi:Uma2 family endonuclease